MQGQCFWDLPEPLGQFHHPSSPSPKSIPQPSGAATLASQDEADAGGKLGFLTWVLTYYSASEGTVLEEERRAQASTANGKDHRELVLDSTCLHFPAPGNFSVNLHLPTRVWWPFPPFSQVSPLSKTLLILLMVSQPIMRFST